MMETSIGEESARSAALHSPEPLAKTAALSALKHMAQCCSPGEHTVPAAYFLSTGSYCQSDAPLPL